MKYLKRLAFTVDETQANIQHSGYRVRPIGVKSAPGQATMWEMNLKSFITHPAGADGTVGPSLDELKPDLERALKAVRNGSGVMPAYQDKLTAEEIEAVANYVSRVAGKPD